MLIRNSALAISKTTDRAEGKHCLPEFVQLNALWSIARLRVFLSRTIQQARRHFAVKMGLIEGYKLELHSLVRRIALRSEKSRESFLLHLGPVFHLGPTGLPEECIRMRGCTRDIENFAASRPWATAIEWEVFRDGWEAGARWNQNNRCICTSANTVSSLSAPSFAGSAAPVLNSALADISEPPRGSVFASGAGHGFSPLDFCGDRPQNLFGFRSWLTPRFGLACRLL